MAKTDRLNRYRPWMLSLLRIATGFVFVEHGAQKLFGVLGGMGGMHLAFPDKLWFAGVIEFVGGLLILVGLLTRLAAFISAGEMAYAYLTAHGPHSFWPLVNHGELAVLYCFIFLYLVTAGAGPISLDHMFRKRR